MRWAAIAVVVTVALVSAGGCATPATFGRAGQAMRLRRFTEARDVFAALASRGDRHQQVRAALGAAHAAAALGDRDDERRWLERAAADPAVAGLSEEAWYELGVVLERAGGHATCLSWYYRAAAASERSGRRDLYLRAIERITHLGMVAR